MLVTVSGIPTLVKPLQYPNARLPILVTPLGITMVLNLLLYENASSKIMGQVYEGQVFTIVEEKNGFGKLKSGAGWISLSTKYVKKI